MDASQHPSTARAVQAVAAVRDRGRGFSLPRNQPTAKMTRPRAIFMIPWKSVFPTSSCTLLKSW